MALDTVRLIDSDTFILSTGDEFKAALALWCKSWSQVPAGSLPTNEKLLTGLSGAKNWKKVRDVALRNWVLCSDGRYYHPIVCEKAMEALPARKAHAEKKVADAERKERERADRKRLFELLRENGITPDFHTTTTKLREFAVPIIDRMKSQDVTRDKSHEVTAKKEQDRTGQERTGPVLEDSVPTGTGGKPPVAGVDVVKTPKIKTPAEQEKSRLWGGIKTKLVEQETCKTIADAGVVAGGIAQKYGNDVFLEAAKATLEADPGNVHTYFIGLCERAAGKRVPLSRGGPATDASLAAANAISDAEAKRLLFGDAANDGATNTGNVIDA